jgi:HK97 family phage major capsid protein
MAMDAKLKELYDKRAGLFEKMKALMKKADDEKRDMNAEEEGQWNAMDQDVEAITRDIEKREKLASISNALSVVRPPAVVPTSAPAPVSDFRMRGNGEEGETEDQKKERLDKEMEVWRSWVRFGESVLDQEQRKYLKRYRTFMKPSDLPPEIRAQATQSDAAGGYLVPEGFSGQLEKALKAYGGVRSVARAFPTPDGADIPWPTVDDTANVGELLGENSQAAAQDVVFGSVILKAFKYSSKIVLVPIELLQDSFFNVDDLLRDLLTERIGRITNTHFTTGGGTGMPQGVVTASGSGKVGLSGQTTSIIYDDIVDMEHSVNSAYRSGASWMFADTTLKALKKIKDTTGRPIWMPGLVAGEPSTINGYGYTINDDMAAMAANAKSILFGNFSKFVVRDVLAVTLLRLVERYAEFGQVGFIAFSRHDSRAINSAALKYYQNSAT